MRLWLSVCSVVCSLLVTSAVWAQLTLESPAPGDSLTGIGLISGWACRAQSLNVRFDGAGPAIPILYGSSREDTRSTCGTANTGFALLYNWNLLGAGEHTITVSVDGRVRLSRRVTVVEYGEEFLSGADGEWTLEDWPNRGVDTVVAWSEARQNIEIVDILGSGIISPEPLPPTPQPPAQEGIGQLLGTWRFTNSHTTQTYRFPRVETCRGSGAGQCLYDDTQGAGLGAGEIQGYSYVLIHPDGAICRAYFLFAPTGDTVQGHYGYGVGACSEDAVVNSLAEHVVLKRYPTTGRRSSQASSQIAPLGDHVGDREEMQDLIEDLVGELGN